MDFIIKKPKSFNRTIRMPEDLIDRMNEIAAAKGVSFNQLVVQCCEFALQHLKEPMGGKETDK